MTGMIPLPVPKTTEDEMRDGVLLWRLALAFVFLLGGLIAWLRLDVLQFTVQTWNSNQTYTHGYIILPISAWLIWQRRSKLAGVLPRPDALALAPLGLASLVWLLGSLARVMVVQQYAVMLMFLAGIWGVVGRDVARRIAFPLGFMILAVPFGEAFLPPMMEFTADFTVAGLRLTGIPVFREGLYFTVPSGSWSVVEACSGLRYLIASFTLGLLYAYFTYRSLARKLAFVAASVVVPILANGIRAYIIVMIGHLSDMRLAVGVDHLVYGWVFFGVVMLLLFWVGAFWREDVEALPQPPRGLGAVSPVRGAPGRLVAMGCATLVFVGASHSLSARLDAADGRDSSVPLTAPRPAPGWQAEPVAGEAWRPDYQGMRAEIATAFRGRDGVVNLRILYYRDQEQGRELVTTPNTLVASKNPAWRKSAERVTSAGSDGAMLQAKEAVIQSAGAQLVVWHWMWVGGESTTSAYRAKWLEAKSKLLGHGDDAALIVLSAPYEGTPDAARKALNAFVSEMLPALDDVLAKARGGAV